MKKMTLLEMVQNIASALETDEINSITDTTESLQIAEVIKETFYEQFNNIFIPEHQGLFTLQSLSDLNSPNYLRIPDNISKVLWLRYNDYRLNNLASIVDYVSPDDFLFTQFQYTADFQGVVPTTDPSSGVIYHIPTNSRPTLFTMFDDKHIAFNSIDLEYENTVQGTNAVGYGAKSAEFLMEDDFIPPIDGNLFPLLLSESKAVCFINLKQVASAKEEQRARRQRIRMQNDQFKARRAQYDYRNDRNNYSRHRG